MTGTERAALRLALGVLRQSVLDSPQPGRSDDCGVDGDVWSDAIEVLTAGGHAPFLVGFHLSAAVKWVDDRALRARACLYIRAVLRADSLGWDWRALAGDECEEDGMTGGELGRLRLHDDTPYFLVGDRLARPLWLDVTEHCP